MARGYGEPIGNEYGAEGNDRDRWRDRERERSNWRSGGQGTSEREDERGFLERAGDEVRSWFSDDDDNRRESERSSWNRDRDRDRGYGRVGSGGSDYRSEDRGGFGGMAQGGMMNRGYGRPGGSDRDRDRGFGPSRGGGSWSSMSDRDRERMGGRSGYGGRGERGRSHPQGWDEPNRGSDSLGYGNFGGTLGGFGNQTFGSSQDDHYRSWRDRQMQQLDRDYEDYCREREQRFHSDFDSWRGSRQGQQGQSGQSGSSGTMTGTTGTGGMTDTAGSQASTPSSSGSATGTPGESSAIGGGSLASESPTQSDTGETLTGGSGSGVSGRSRNRS